jgi:transposase
MISAFKYFGGIPQEILFDNMKTVVDRTINRLSLISNLIKHSSILPMMLVLNP